MKRQAIAIVLALTVCGVARADEKVEALALQPEPALVGSLKRATGLRAVAFERVRATSTTSAKAGVADPLERRGVRVRLDGLTVERLDLATPAAALTWAQTLAARGPHVVEVRGRHVVIVQGAQAANHDRVAGVLGAIWTGEAARAPRALLALTTASGDEVVLGARGLAEAEAQRDASQARFGLGYDRGERTVDGVRFKWGDPDFVSGVSILPDGRARAFQTDGPDGGDGLPAVVASAGSSARLRDALRAARGLASGRPAPVAVRTPGLAGALEGVLGR